MQWMDGSNRAWMTLANDLLLTGPNHQVRFLQEDYFLELPEQVID